MGCPTTVLWWYMVSSCHCMACMEVEPCYNVSTPVSSLFTVSSGIRMARSSTGEWHHVASVTQYGTDLTLVLCQQLMEQRYEDFHFITLLYCSYLPGKPDPITIHNVEGITLDVSVMSDNSQNQSCPDTRTKNKKYFPLQRQRQSNEYQVYLTHLSQASTGRYRCEVSEEGPMFATDSAYGDLLVVVTPHNGPSITGHNNKR